jgi:hypothetical protein
MGNPLNFVSRMNLVMADPNIKTVKIFNKAPEEPDAIERLSQEGGEKKRSTRKKKYIIKSVTVQKEGGGSTSPGTAEQLASTRVPGSDNTKAVGAVSGLTQSGATVGLIAPSSAPSIAGARVVLAKSRKKSSVILAGPKPAALKAHKKTAKKVHVNLKGLTRKVHKAKTIETKATETSLSDVKDTLVKAGLIKAETKAPESVIRQIYSDLMVLKKRAL